MNNKILEQIKMDMNNRIREALDKRKDGDPPLKVEVVLNEDDDGIQSIELNIKEPSDEEAR